MGFLGVCWNYLLTEPIFDEIVLRKDEPITFIKDGVRGGLTIDNEFISIEEFNNMPSEQHKALWTKFVGDQY